MGKNSVLNAAFKDYCVICAHMGDFPKFSHIFNKILTEHNIAVLWIKKIKLCIATAVYVACKFYNMRIPNFCYTLYSLTPIYA